MFSLIELVLFPQSGSQGTYCTDDFPRLVNYRDRFHERHLGGCGLKLLSKACFEGVYGRQTYLGSFVKSAVKSAGYLEAPQNKWLETKPPAKVSCRSTAEILRLLILKNKRGCEREKEEGILVEGILPKSKGKAR